jgi:hypothetical protein
MSGLCCLVCGHHVTAHDQGGNCRAYVIERPSGMVVQCPCQHTEQDTLW